MPRAAEHVRENGVLVTAVELAKRISVSPRASKKLIISDGVRSHMLYLPQRALIVTKTGSRPLLLASAAFACKRKPRRSLLRTAAARCSKFPQGEERSSGRRRAAARCRRELGAAGNA